MKTSTIALTLAILFASSTTFANENEGSTNAHATAKATSNASNKSYLRATIYNRTTNENANNQEQSQKQEQSQNQSTQNANNASQSTNVGGSTMNFESSDNPVSSAYAPTVFPTAPCMGSTSGGAQTGLFGFSVGTSWESKDCMMLETARSFEQAGYAEDALVIRCKSKYAKDAPSCKALNESVPPLQ